MDAVILRCLEKDPEGRLQTVQEIIPAPWKNRILTQAPFNPDSAGYNLRNRCRLRGNPWD